MGFFSTKVRARNNIILIMFNGFWRTILSQTKCVKLLKHNIILSNKFQVSYSYHHYRTGLGGHRTIRREMCIYICLG